MKWLLVVLLTLFGQRDRDATYDRACVRLDRATRGAVTCPLLEDWVERARRRGNHAPDDDDARISNGF